MNKTPFAFRLLRTFCPEHLYEEIEGDLIQKLSRDKRKFSDSKANRRLYWNVIRFFRPGIILRNKLPQKLINTIMVKNYFVVAWRNFLKRKFLSSINIIGLSFGIAFALLSFLFIYDEFSFDTTHTNRDLIYRVEVQPFHDDVPQLEERSLVVHSAFVSTAKGEIAGIDYITRYASHNKYLMVNETESRDIVTYVDEDFINMFSVEFIKGSAKSALSTINTMIMSDEQALKLFGTTDVLGKRIDTRQASFTVSGVFKALPKNSTLGYGILTRFENMYGKDAPEDSWNSSYYNVFIQRKPTTSLEALNAAFKKMATTNLPPAVYPTYTKRTDFSLVPLHEIHFDVKSGWVNVSSKVSSYILGTIAVMVLLVACLNYVLLSLAGSASRTREIGVRKVIGATRKMIRLQFLSESVVIILVSVPVSLIMLYLILPEFNNFMGKTISLGEASKVWIGALCVIVLITGLLAGGYPAATLSHLVPQKILKGNTSGSYKTKFSGVLIVFQFAACLVMLICAVIMFNQMKMIQERDLGFNKDQIVVIDTKNDRGVPGGKIVNNFRSELAQDPNILMISSLSNNFGSMGGSSSKTDGKGEKIFEYYCWIDYDFFEMLDIKLIEGRFFSRNFADTIPRRLIVNQAFAKQLTDSSSALGPMPNRPGDEVIGVVENFNFESLENEVKPMAFELSKHGLQLMVKISPNDIPGSIARLETCWKKVAGDSKFSFTFFDDYINNQYKRYTQWIRLVTISASLAIGIACLGLLGIISLAVINRTKEIGIRKVLGATTTRILVLFSKYYLRLIIAAFILSLPAAYYLSTLWLQDFAYKINIHWTHYAYPMTAIIILTFIIIASQVIKTVRINPAETLKSE